VKQYVIDSPRCQVDKYLNALPEDAASSDVLYLKPLPKLPSDPNAQWFTNVPVGKNKLGDMLKDMCKEIGLEKFTNHSLRAYGNHVPGWCL